jgi:very-short-patch-repair endonuclease
VLDGPFRGSVAVQRGLLTRGQLYGPRYRRLLPDVYVLVGTKLDLTTRSRAAYLHVAPRGGVLAGYSAAELLGRGCALRRVSAEVLVPRDVRRRSDLLVRRGTVPRSEVVSAGGCRVTCPVRTAWDLARRLPLVDAVVAVDALARRRSPTDPGFDLDGLLAYRAAAPGARSCRVLDRVVALADRRSESVLETRLRLNLVLGGLPVPDVQYRVHDDYGFVLARVDLAYPSARLAIEYDGETHFTPTRSRADRQRDLTLADLGWHTMRLTYDDVDGDPPRTRQRVATLLQARTPRATPVQL